MFYYIKGTVAHTEPSMVVIDCGGVGYALQTSMRSSTSVHPGDQATFYTHLNVREDVFELYGFCDMEELDLFRRLISVSGVGPRAALAMLSTLNPSALIVAIISEDLKALTKAPGVGKKLAQRVALELKDKLSAPADAGAEVPDISSEPGGTAYEDALDALVVLGYSRQQAVSALRGVATEGAGVDDLVRAALKKLY